ncbi:hypothetical protein, partial [Stenotrophomonas sp. SrG]|uniref:hypothetical protein n=1 Tax=Stenotrophomonas sp. SrG TaxID=3414430 RepID=UPI003CF0ADB0
RTSAGANMLFGGLGNDRYILSANDTAVELAGEGSDAVVIEAPEPGTPQTQMQYLDFEKVGGTAFAAS